MKRIFAFFMTVVLLALMSACGGNTIGNQAGTTVPTTVAPTVDPALGVDGLDDYDGDRYVLVENNTEWHYKLFSMKFTGMEGDRFNLGTFDPDTDTMASYMADHNWNMGDEKLPASVLEDVENWSVNRGPFGDHGGNYHETDIGFEGDNHGLMICATFNIIDLAEFLYDYDALNFYCHYDNTVSIYLNDTLVYRHSIDEAGTPDWNGDRERLNTYYKDVNAYYIGDEAVMELLVEGDNTLLAMVKDGWGGRVLNLSLECG